MPFFVQGLIHRMEPGGGAKGHEASRPHESTSKRRARPSGGKEHQPQSGRAQFFLASCRRHRGLSLSSGTNTCSERNKALKLTWMIPSAELLLHLPCLLSLFSWMPLTLLHYEWSFFCPPPEVEDFILIMLKTYPFYLILFISLF